MKEVEALASTRIMTEGVSRTEATGNIVAALYTHDTSRELDPQLHAHSLVLNATWAEGKWRALSSDAAHMNTGFGKDMFNNKLALGQIYRHALRQDVEAMGFETGSPASMACGSLKECRPRSSANAVSKSMRRSARMPLPSPAMWPPSIPAGEGSSRP